eukprot:g1293.t1
MAGYFSLIALFCAVGFASSSFVQESSSSSVDLVTFDGKEKSTTWTWKVLNDPVMGGQSTSTWEINQTIGIAIWDGETKIVPSLKAPGFCNAETTSGFGVFSKANDASAFTHLLLRVRSTVEYNGFKVSLAADTLNPQFNSFKSEFNVTRNDGVWHTVGVPFSSFSNDWSSYTGRCDTVDPSGKKHKCCSKETPEVCLTEKNLADISQFGIWTEGIAGKFHLEVKWIRAGFGAGGCESTEYCCPDALHCLTPTKTSCKESASVCGNDETCCPLSKLCVKVGAACESPCKDTNAYCCPDAKKCLVPTNPGALCGGPSDCSDGEVCCPLLKECVKPGVDCDPGTPDNSPSFLADTASYTCGVCGHVYDAQKDGGGVAFEDLPDTWTCPVCGAPKSAYTKATLSNGIAAWVH